MADLRISQLPELFATGLTPSAEFAVAQAGTTYKIKNQNLSPFPYNYGLFSQTGDSVVISATTTESTLIGGGVGVLSVPANAFQVGDTFTLIMGGMFTAGNNEDIRIRLKSNAVELSDSGFQNLAGTSGLEVWRLQVTFVVRNIGSFGTASIVTTGEFIAYKTNNSTSTGFAFNTVNNTTFDTTISNTLNITAQWDSTSTSNSIYSDIFNLRKVY